MSADLTTSARARFSVRFVPASGRNLTEEREFRPDDRR
jgi:hypothetical protein